MAYRSIVLTVLGFVLGAIPGALAQSAADVGPVAVVSAQAGDTIPSQARMAVEPRDDSDLNLRLGEVIAKELAKLGYVVDENAPLRFTFATDVQNNMPDNSRFRLQARGGQRSDIEWELTMRLAGGGGPSDVRGTAPLYGVEIVIDRAGELPLWSGKAVTSTRTSDTYRASQALAKILLTRLGRDADNETVPLP